MRSDDGTRLTVRRAGQGDPLVLVHGSAGGLGSWDPVLPLLAGHFETWVYARRGYLPSDGCTRAKTFADDVADLRAVIAAAGAPARVVGGSYGGTVGLHAALDGGSDIRTLTVFEPPLFAGGGLDALAHYRAAFDAGDLRAANRIFAAEVARFPGEVGAADPAEAIGMLHDLEALAADTADVTRWADIGVPVRIVSGGDTWDPMPATMDSLAAALPKATRVVLAGQSHFATHTAPAAFAEALHW